MPNPTPIFWGFLAPPPKTGHFDIFWKNANGRMWGSGGVKNGHFWGHFLGVRF
jgi:hypothetical protein